jgi:transcriptional regulator NrdR family protein
MRCTACPAATHVLDTRPAGDHAIRRRRECESCGERFTTIERTIAADEIETAVLAFVRSLDAEEATP